MAHSQANQLQNALDSVPSVPVLAEEPEETSKSRLELIMGKEALTKLADSCVLIAGIGGVGSNCMEALARGGVGRLILVDSDTVAASNINRQAVAFTSTVGQPKVEVAKAMIAQINPECQVDIHQEFLLVDEVEALFERYAGQIDYVVDAVDTVTAKLALARCAQEAGIPVISAMGAANRLHPERLKFADLFETENCPLCRAMRKGARKHGIQRLSVLYSDEPATTLPGGALGSMSFFPPIMGQMMASRVILELSGLE